MFRPARAGSHLTRSARGTVPLVSAMGRLAERVSNRELQSFTSSTAHGFVCSEPAAGRLPVVLDAIDSGTF